MRELSFIEKQTREKTKKTVSHFSPQFKAKIILVLRTIKNYVEKKKTSKKR